MQAISNIQILCVEVKVEPVSTISVIERLWLVFEGYPSL